jgi:hypothetical protein
VALGKFGLGGGKTLNSLGVTALSNGNFLLTVQEQDANYNTSPEQILEISSACQLVKTFGSRGFLIPRIPGVQLSAGFTSSGTTAYTGETFSVFPSLGGNFFVAGATQRTYVIGKYSGDGVLQRSFGNHGWTTLSPPMAEDQFGASVSTILTAKNGNIYVYGNNGYPHSEVQPVLSQLNSDGSLNRQFGADHGYSLLFPSFYNPDGLVLLPQGSLVAFGQAWGGGAGLDSVEWVSPQGLVESSASTLFSSSGPPTSLHYYLGFSFLDPHGDLGIFGLNFSDSITGKVDNISLETVSPNGQVLTLKNNLQKVLNLSGGTCYSDIQGIAPLKGGGYLVADAGGFQLMGAKFELLPFGKNGTLVMGHSQSYGSSSTATSPLSWAVNSQNLIGATAPSQSGFIFQIARA